jgi:hypothetical protein
VIFEEIQQHFPSNAMLLRQESHEVLFSIPSKVVSNGSLVLKHVQINNYDNQWSLHITGKEIDLKNLGINSKYDGTLSCLTDLLAITGKLRLCTGVPMSSGKKVIPHSFQNEFISICGDENSKQAHLRSNACKVGIPWSNRNNICISCQRAMSRVEKANLQFQENEISLSETDHNDVSTILEKVFPKHLQRSKNFCNASMTF